MQLKDLVTPIDKQTDDELLTRLREIRHRREVIRPAQRKRVERAETKTARREVAGLNKLVENLSDAEKEALVKKLMEQTEDSE